MTEERVNFSVVRDDFSIFELENGQILKAQFSLIDIINTTNTDNTTGKLAIQPFSAVITPSNIKKYDIEYTQGNATSDDEVKELEFTETQNKINIYETKKSLIVVAIKMMKVFLTNKLDKDGNPHLRYKSEAAMSVVEKPFLNGQSEAKISK